METSVAGVAVTGDWEDVVARGETVSEVLRDAGADDEAVDAWDAWRPREHESLREEVREKTAEQAAVGENRIEADGRSTTDAVGEAIDGMERAVEQAANGDPDAASAHTRAAVRGFALSVDTVLRKCLRRVEKAVYRHVVTRTNPCYFDAADVSASVRRENTLQAKMGAAEERYRLQVAVQDGDVEDAVADRLEDEIAADA